MNITDIDGTSSKLKKVGRTRSPGFDNYDYNDVTAKPAGSGRHTNPLDPVYKWKGVDKGVEFTEIGEVEGSKPIKMPDAPKNKELMRSLKTEDILGAKTSTKGLGPFEQRPRRDVADDRDHNLKISDINGSTAGSLLKGIKTNRKHSPLRNDDYYLPGWKDELLKTQSKFEKTPHKGFEQLTNSLMKKTGE